MSSLYLEVKGQNEYFLIELYLKFTLDQNPLSRVDSLKTMAARGWGFFALYGYSENFSSEV